MVETPLNALHASIFSEVTVANDWWSRAGFISGMRRSAQRGFGGASLSRFLGWFRRVAVILLLVACYSAWKDQYWTTQGWIGANNDMAGKFQICDAEERRIERRTATAPSQVAGLKQLASSPKSVTQVRSPN